MTEDRTKETEGATEETEEESAAAEVASPGVELRFKDEAEKQAWLDRQFSGRYKRKQEKIRDEERKKAETEIRQQEQEKRGEYENLYKASQDELRAARTRITELEQAAESSEEQQGRIEALENRVRGYVEADLALLPEHFREAVTLMGLEQQADWLTRHRDKLRPEAPVDEESEGATPGVVVLPPTVPGVRPEAGKKQRDEEREAIETQRRASMSNV